MERKSPSILDKSFAYRSAAKTDIRKTFKRERERLKREAAQPTAEIITPGQWLANRGK